MSKRIAYCADGTWDSTPNVTNVYRLSKALLPITGDQVTCYDDGVGADGNPISKVLGGAFGTGLWSKVKQGYAQIAHVYDAGDPLYLFGFSRGAYTARSLAGMIAVCGLPTKNPTDNLVDAAFSAYRDKINRDTILASLGDYGMFDAQITMVGVWDTVGSLGIPSGIGLSDPVAYGFLDTSLHPDVHNACQAMAIDEKRLAFPVTKWDGAGPGQTLEQIWFTGVHSDVGGGEKDDRNGQSALSDITFGWMLDRAGALGLVFDPGVAAGYKLPLDAKYAYDELHSSWNILWGIPQERTVTDTDTISNSVLIRCRMDSAYRPGGLKLVGDSPTGNFTFAPILAPPQAGAQVQATGA